MIGPPPSGASTSHSSSGSNPNERAFARTGSVGTDASRAPVAAEDQAAARRDDLSEKPFDEGALSLIRDVDQLGAHEVEPLAAVPR